MKPWLKNGKMIRVDGRPVLCSECPCKKGETVCEKAVKSRVKELLEMEEEGQPVWFDEGTVTCTYKCPEWIESSSEPSGWELVSPASGTLVGAYQRGTEPAFGCQVLTYAVNLRNASGQYKVVGCSCSSTYEGCTPELTELDDYFAYGTINVWEAPEGYFYSPSDGCRTENCDRLIKTLNAQAVFFGGDFHTEGVIVKLVTNGGVWGDFYNFTEKSYPYYQTAREIVKCAWDYGDKLYCVYCDCDHISSKNNPLHGSCREWIWLYYPNACTCLDERELIMMYPDVFGVREIGYGSNRKYKITQKEIWEDWEEDPETGEWYPVEIEYTWDEYDTVVPHYNDSNPFLDYRTLSYIVRYIKDDGEIIDGIGYFSPEGSPLGSAYPWDENGKTGYNAEMIGWVLPFTHDNEINWSYAGRIIEWRCHEAVCRDADRYTICGQLYDTAVETANTIVRNESFCGIEGYDCRIELPRISPPDLQLKKLFDKIEPYEDPSRGTGDWKWCSRSERWSIGGCYNDSDGGGHPLAYREQYITTNRGYLLKGQGYTTDFIVYGMGQDHQGCYTHSVAPINDSHLTFTPDESMHGCIEDFPWYDSESSES